MLERSRYVTDDDFWIGGNSSGKKIGMVYIVEENGFFGLGWSLCHEDDKFDPVEAKFIARGRAVKDLLENKRLFKDIANHGNFSEFGINIPGAKKFFTDDGVTCSIARRLTRDAFSMKLRLCINDMIYTCALEYLRASAKKGEL